jgi:ABC-type bacteriocin/lantibiotic exporter with double-glycine peptidase domain
MEAMEHIRTVQALTREKTFIDKFAACLARPHVIALKKSFVQAPCYALATSTMYFLYAAAFVFGAFLIRVGDSEPMDLLRYVLYRNFSLLLIMQILILVYGRHWNKNLFEIG